MQQYGNSFFSTPPHLDFQGSQKNFWRAPTLNKAISDLKEGKKRKRRVQFNTGNWQRFKLHLILAKAVHQSWGEMWIFSSSQMPNYSFFLILLLRSCQGCTHPSISRHLNTTPETSELCDVGPVLPSPCNLSGTPADDSIWQRAPRAEMMLPLTCRGTTPSRKHLWGCHPALTRQEHALFYGVFKQSYCVTNNSISFALGRTQDWIHSLLLTMQWGLPQIAESKWKGMAKRVKRAGCAAQN